MKDPEFIMLRNRFLLGLLVIFIFFIPLFFVFYNRWGVSYKLTKTIEKEKEVLFLVIDNDCSSCQEIKKELKNKKVKYYQVHRVKDREYSSLMERLHLSEKDITPPTIIYIKDKKVVSTLVQKEIAEVDEFIEYYQLGE